MTKQILKDVKPCPCGQTPKELFITNVNSGTKYAYVYGSCCSQWEVEFRTEYRDADSDECMQLAIEAWNEAPRFNIEPLLEIAEAAMKAHDSFYTVVIDAEQSAPASVRYLSKKISELGEALNKVDLDRG